MAMSSLQSEQIMRELNAIKRDLERELSEGGRRATATTGPTGTGPTGPTGPTALDTDEFHSLLNLRGGTDANTPRTQRRDHDERSTSDNGFDLSPEDRGRSRRTESHMQYISESEGSSRPSRGQGPTSETSTARSATSTARTATSTARTATSTGMATSISAVKSGAVKASTARSDTHTKTQTHGDRITTNLIPMDLKSDVQK